MCKVFNKRHGGVPADAVYIGRPSKWGNPFTHLSQGTTAQYFMFSRDEAVDAYEQWLLKRPALVAAAKQELRGKDLVCWCAPARCHGDVLLKIANS